VYFYELHEGDDRLMADVILARETAMSREDFFELVQEVRSRVEETFEEDSLAEAIAGELEREHDFLFISDARILASVRVSSVPGETALMPEDADHGARNLDAGRWLDDEDPDDEADLDELPDYLTIIADLEPPTRLS